MELSEAERAVLERFYEKTRIAGGAKPGYIMRRQAICYHADRHPGIDFDRGLGALVEKGLLKPNEAGDRFALTEAGAAELETWRG